MATVTQRRGHEETLTVPVSRPMPYSMSARETAKAILTDVQFWIPAAVLLAGVALLVALH